MTLSRYWHTLRYLRPVQFYGRLWFRLYRPRPDIRPAPGLRPATGSWMAPAAKPISLLGPATLRFLNQTHEVAGSGAWNDPARDKLWLYNLHYFDDLNAEGAAKRRDWHRALIARWIAENPPGHGNGWEPYPLSLRIVNWLQWALGGKPAAVFRPGPVAMPVGAANMRAWTGVSSIAEGWRVRSPTAQCRADT